MRLLGGRLRLRALTKCEKKSRPLTTLDDDKGGQTVGGHIFPLQVRPFNMQVGPLFVDLMCRLTEFFKQIFKKKKKMHRRTFCIVRQVRQQITRQTESGASLSD
jgi:hypothetical protein